MDGPQWQYPVSRLSITMASLARKIRPSDWNRVESGAGLAREMGTDCKWRSLPSRIPVDHDRVDPQVLRHVPSLHSNIARTLLATHVSSPAIPPLTQNRHCCSIPAYAASLPLYAGLDHRQPATSPTLHHWRRCITGNITSSPCRVIASLVSSLSHAAIFRFPFILTY
jgi:hypothetical protein